jgi:hypothetical protein
MGKGFWDALYANASAATGRPLTARHDMRPTLQAAVKGGVNDPTVPGRKSFAVPNSTLNRLGVRLAPPELVQPAPGSGWRAKLERRFPDPNTRQQQLQQWFESSMQDPNSYAMEITPLEYFRRTYGDDLPGIFQSALLSASRPAKELAGHPILESLTPGMLQVNVKEPVVAIRTPGLGYEHEGRLRFGMFGPPNLAIWPRALDGTATPAHEMRHAAFHRQDPSDAQKPLFESPHLASLYKSRHPEAVADAGVLKANEYMLTGRGITNKAAAEDFMQKLLQPPPPRTAPDPAANFGPRPGKPIPDYNHMLEVWGKMMQKATSQDKAKFIELLPKVMDTTKPRAVA